MSFPVSHLGIGTLLLLIAAAADVRKRRIPNALNAAVGLTGLWAQASVRGWAAMGLSLAAGVLVVALLWLPWLSRLVGGGDVKLAGAGAIWSGLSLLPMYLLVTAVAGGLVGIVCYALSARATRREIRENLVTTVREASLPAVPIKGGAGRVPVPYGAAFAMSALVMLWTGGRW
jgi:prepilin peptidase CpaA